MSSSPPPPPATYQRGLSQASSQTLPPQSHQSQARSSTQRCENCRSKRLYTQDGRLWCRRCGTLQEDFVQTQQDDDFGTLRSSQVTRQKKESKEKVKKTFTGTKALYLYLSVYQLILRHLCRSLIDTKGLPSTLEILVKDLWELRMKLIHERYLAIRPQNQDDGEQSDNTMYSCQTETEYTHTDEDETTDGNEELSIKVRKERDFPSIIDMLALCYMACMILRIPLSIGSIFRWAAQEEIPFLRPLRLVPPEMQHRLSSQWLPLLQTRAPLRPSKLYSAIHDLHALYARHFSIELPPLNHVPLSYHYITTLSLPIDLLPAVTHLSSILANSFSFPRTRRRRTFLALPEIQLVSFLAIASKIFHPFSQNGAARQSQLGSSLNHMSTLGILPLNWSAWLAAQQSISEKIDRILTSESQPFKPGEQVHVSTQNVFEFTPDQTDSYMDWFEKTWLDAVPRQMSRDLGAVGDESGDEGTAGGVMAEILKMFSPSRHELHQSQDTGDDPGDTANAQTREAKLRIVREDAIKQIQSSAILSDFPFDNNSNAKDNNNEPPPRSGENYIHYRYPSDLGEAGSAARVFHESLATQAGLETRDLLKAIYKTERRLIKWWDKERKRRKDQPDPDPDLTSPSVERDIDMDMDME